MDTTPTVINAAGKLTALGGSALSDSVTAAMAKAAQQHVDLATLRGLAGQSVAEFCGAEAGCITSGAAAGLAISVAAILTGQSLNKVRRLPQVEGENRFLLQAGHNVDFGASVEQMIRLGGGSVSVIGMTNNVPERLLIDTLNEDKYAALVYVQSHHCVQENMISLTTCIEHCHHHEIPVIVDAAAEEDLCDYINAGADLVTYSGGKAFCGPTSGFVVGRGELIAACEMQFRGIARTMKVGKEQILGLMQALDEYTSQDLVKQRNQFNEINSCIMAALSSDSMLKVNLKPDEAGRTFERISIAASEQRFPIKDLVDHLANSSPSIRTRNHHLDQGYLLIDPREINAEDAKQIVSRVQSFTEAL